MGATMLWLMLKNKITRLGVFNVLDHEKYEDSNVCARSPPINEPSPFASYWSINFLLFSCDKLFC